MEWKGENISVPRLLVSFYCLVIVTNTIAVTHNNKRTTAVRLSSSRKRERERGKNGQHTSTLLSITQLDVHEHKYLSGHTYCTVQRTQSLIVCTTRSWPTTDRIRKLVNYFARSLYADPSDLRYYSFHLIVHVQAG